MYPNEMCRWTPVALSADVPTATVVPAWTPQGQIALWRSQSGVLAASSDRCPHRGMRLSYGFVRGEALSCIYHGWSYGKDGRCLRIPAHPGLTPPETINTQNQTVEERDGVVWVTGDGTPGMAPPTFPDTVPLRTITVAASAAALRLAVEVRGTGDNGASQCSLVGQPVTLLLVAQSADNTLVHILVASNASSLSRIKISRAAELMRLKAEKIQSTESAS